MSLQIGHEYFGDNADLSMPISESLLSAFISSVEMFLDMLSASALRNVHEGSVYSGDAGFLR